MNKISEDEFVKVTGQVFDPSREVKKTNNVFNNINIADDIATIESTPLNQLVQQSKSFSANHRSDKDIKANLRDLS